MKTLFSLIALCLIHTIAYIEHAQCLELNYRLLDKPHIQNFIDTQLEKIEEKYFSFLTSVMGLEDSSNLVTFISKYNHLGASIGFFRKDCIYTFLETTVPADELKNRCQNTCKELLQLIRDLDNSLANANISKPQFLTKSQEAIYLSPTYPFLHYSVSTTVSKLEPSIASMALYSYDRNKVADQFSLEIGNQLSALHKIIRQGILEFIPLHLKRDTESFWLFYINVLQERPDPKGRRDYWAVNIFDLNIKVNEFFYGCERNKRILSKDSYMICDDIHKEWNNILRQTLKF